MCCSVYSSTLATSLIPWLLCGGGGKRTWYTRSRMCKVPLVTCLLLEIFCLPAERLHCKVILPVRHLRAVLKSETIISLTANVYISLFKTIGELQKEDCVSQSVMCHSI